MFKILRNIVTFSKIRNLYKSLIFFARIGCNKEMLRWKRLQGIFKTCLLDYINQEQIVLEKCKYRQLCLIRDKFYCMSIIINSIIILFFFSCSSQKQILTYHHFLEQPYHTFLDFHRSGTFLAMKGNFLTAFLHI